MLNRTLIQTPDEEIIKTVSWQAESSFGPGLRLIPDTQNSLAIILQLELQRCLRKSDNIVQIAGISFTTNRKEIETASALFTLGREHLEGMLDGKHSVQFNNGRLSPTEAQPFQLFPEIASQLKGHPYIMPRDIASIKDEMIIIYNPQGQLINVTPQQDSKPNLFFMLPDSDFGSDLAEQKFAAILMHITLERFLRGYWNNPENKIFQHQPSVPIPYISRSIINEKAVDPNHFSNQNI